MANNRYKDLLRASAANEAKALADAKKHKSSTEAPEIMEPADKEAEKASDETAEEPVEETPNETVEEPAEEATKESPTEEAPTEEPAKEKKRGGRPTNAERGLVCRKQYTLTLEKETYQMFLNKARDEKLSFAMFMEKAALEYIERHE